MKPGMDSDRVLLGHIRECIERVREYTGGDQATSHASRLVQDAVVRNLQTLAEWTQRLSAAIKSTEKDVPWQANRATTAADLGRGLLIDPSFATVCSSVPLEPLMARRPRVIAVWDLIQETAAVLKQVQSSDSLW